MANIEKWDFWIDRGGTFTDIVAKNPAGHLLTHKLLSDNPAHYKDAALQGIRDLMGCSKDTPLPAEKINTLKMGTTVATNALLERKGEPTLFVTTAGFADALSIGAQNRPKIFALAIERPQMLYKQVLEVQERVNATGDILTPLDEANARKGLEDAFAQGLRSVAICLVHGYRFHTHEKLLATIAKDIGFTQISASHMVSPLMKYVPRGDTTVVDAYLSPILRRYIDHIEEEIRSKQSGCRLSFMQSNGGLTDAHMFQGKDAILSGPAGGVVGMVQTGLAAGYDKIIGFDMGGTSTDVSHYAGDYERSFETEVAGVRMRAPMMTIHTVAAGGGSLASYDGARMRVGPDSAGAEPGPAAYRKGGPLTVTDANVMLGKLNPKFFPALFGPGGSDLLDEKIVREKFSTLAAEIGGKRAPEDIADGFIAIAVENMAQAIKKISVARGYDVSSYVLSCFGGAGAQHACLVADALDIKKILIHPFAGLLSAYGMGLADIRAHREESVEAPLTQDTIDALQMASNARAAECKNEVSAQGIKPNQISLRQSLHLRYDGSDASLPVDFTSLDAMSSHFEALHKTRFGFHSPEKKIIIEALAVEAIGKTGELKTQSLDIPTSAPTNTQGKLSTQTTKFYSQGSWCDAQVWAREKLRVGDRLHGPALIIEPHSTIIVEPEWCAELTNQNNIVLTRIKTAKRIAALGTTVDPVMLEIFNNLFMSIAEQMGFTLERTAQSVNIKERLDFSCALFDAKGGLVANAPHMPVHLGSMGTAVKAIINANPQIKPGDVFALNDPYHGGTHLPDITVIAPVFDKTTKALLFYVAARGHHSDIGGLTPGSMPATSTSISQEGILITNLKIVEDGTFQEKTVLSKLLEGPYPARNPQQNIADLKAQIAACTKGALELEKMVDDFGLATVQAYMGHVQDNAEECVRRVIDVLSDCEFSVPMDGGALIKLAIRVDKEKRSAEIDFTGTSAQLSTNFNAPSSICRAAVLYVFRCLVDDDIPLNEGCLKPLSLIIPEGCFLNPSPPAAVVAGNVETSQHITDALFGALGVMAAAQGTMNNLTFGNSTHQYYETLCGGAGAGRTFDGASAAHTHMTNSRLTDVEVLEWRFPVLLTNFAVRTGSGGNGQHHGGNGIIREIQFKEQMELSILSTRRETDPFGLEGGMPGERGLNMIIRKNGAQEHLTGCAQTTVQVDDRLIIKTPGGGGFGRPA